ncbi:MAG: hypothetical protein AAF747_05020 [Planctomycetota bacterium]
MPSKLNTTALIAAIAGFALASPAVAQFGRAVTSTATEASAERLLSETELKRSNLRKLMRSVSIEVENQPLADIITFIGEVTGADIEPRYAEDNNGIGLDPEQEVTVTAKNVSALQLLEMTLERTAELTFGGGNTWQMTPWGSIEVGPKELLANRRRVEVYDITDLLFEIPDYPDAPEVDLQQVLQSNQGGGGGQSPFTDPDDEERDRRPASERAQDVIDILVDLVEPETWEAGGGTASIRYFQGSLIVSGPDYLHRGIDGYSWWPDRGTVVSTTSTGRRYVTMNLRTEISDVVEFVQQPITGTVGGSGGGGTPPGGGG